MKTEDENEKPNDFPKVLWGAGQLADFLGMTTRNLQILAGEKGIAVKDGRGKYDVFATIQNYLNDLRRRESSENAKDAKAVWEEERARLTKARADKAELEFAILRGEAVLMKDVDELISEEYGAFRMGLSQVPNKLARKVAAESDPAKCQIIITDGLEGTMKALTADEEDGKKPRTRTLEGADTVDDDEEIIDAKD